MNQSPPRACPNRSRAQSGVPGHLWLAWMLVWGFLEGHALGKVPQADFTDQERRSNWFPPYSEFGSFGLEPGQLLFPGCLAVGSDEKIYVADSGNHRIQIYSCEGRFLGGWGSLGAGPGEFRDPTGVAVGPKDEVYVTDSGNDRVQVFNSQG